MTLEFSDELQWKWLKIFLSVTTLKTSVGGGSCPRVQRRRLGSYRWDIFGETGGTTRVTGPLFSRVVLFRDLWLDVLFVGPSGFRFCFKISCSFCTDAFHCLSFYESSKSPLIFFFFTHSLRFRCPFPTLDITLPFGHAVDFCAFK